MDSSSSDGSIERIKALTPRSANLRHLHVKRIEQSEFQHGRTRNLCCTLSGGEFIAFLTQDALPKDQFWLYNIVTVLERYPRAAGAFGKHLAWPDASPFTKRDIAAHFLSLEEYPLALSRATRADLHDANGLAWQQVLHYFSDNNSCLRRSIWEQVPYPELDYGEDQAWAQKVIHLPRDDL